MTNEHGTARTTELRTPPSDELLLRIEGEYREMPGLTLTESQATRLWGLDPTTCATALTALTERQVLRRTPGGTYLRRSSD